MQKNSYAAVMMVARWVKGSYCFGVSCLDICKSLKYNLPDLKTSCNLRTQSPHHPQETTDTQAGAHAKNKKHSKDFNKYKINRKKYDRKIISKSLKIYNTIPDYMKLFKPKKFKRSMHKV